MYIFADRNMGDDLDVFIEIASIDVEAKKIQCFRFAEICPETR
jgi:hypothetical protein